MTTATMMGADGLARYALPTLEAQMPGAIATLNARPGAPVQLAVPTHYYLYGEATGAMPELAIHGVAVEVSAADVDLDNLDTASEHADASTPLAVTVWAEEAVDFPGMITRLHLYGMAVVSVLRAPGWAPGGAIVRRASIRVRAADIDPDAPDSTVTKAGAAVIMQVDYDERLSL